MEKGKCRIKNVDSQLTREASAPSIMSYTFFTGCVRI